MKTTKFKIIWFLIFGAVLVTECRTVSNELKEGKKFFSSIPKKEKQPFLAYTLGYEFMKQFRFPQGFQFPFPSLLGISKGLERKFENIRKPENFTNDLYAFVKSRFNLSKTEMFQLILRKSICFPHGKCVDLENIGSLCCPF